MARILIAYSTVDGHTRTICERLRHTIENAGHDVTLASLDDREPPQPQSFDRVVIGASIRYGKHRKNVYDFIQANRQWLEDRPSAFFTVNVVARKPEKDSPETNPYIKGFERKTPWRPTLVGVFAGKIDYPKCGFFDRQVIRLIMWITNGPTDPRGCYEFTDWDRVEEFARRVSLMQ